MKFHKFILMIIGATGLIASILNIFYFEDPSRMNHFGFIGSVILIWVSLTLDRHIKRFSGKKKVLLSEDKLTTEL